MQSVETTTWQQWLCECTDLLLGNDGVAVLIIFNIVIIIINQTSRWVLLHVSEVRLLVVLLVNVITLTSVITISSSSTCSITMWNRHETTLHGVGHGLNIFCPLPCPWPLGDQSLSLTSRRPVLAVASRAAASNASRNCDNSSVLSTLTLTNTLGLYFKILC